MPNVEFSFSEEIIDGLTNGDCWLLASVLHHRAGLPYSALYGDGEIVHIGVSRADGSIVDIEGVWEFYEWETAWVNKLEHIWDMECRFVDENDPEYKAVLEYWEGLEATTYGDKTLGEIADEILSKIKEIPVLV